MDVLGIPLETAYSRLLETGKTIELIEVSCKKGSKGQDRRVIRTEDCSDRILVYWASFQTDAEYHSKGAEQNALHPIDVE